MRSRLLIIDDHEAVRNALAARLGKVAEIEVVGCTGSWQEGVQAVKRLEPHVVLLEVKRADGAGLVALDTLVREAPWTSVLVLTSYMDSQEEVAALRSGATRYLLKDINSELLVHEIRSVTKPRALV